MARLVAFFHPSHPPLNPRHPWLAAPVWSPSRSVSVDCLRRASFLPGRCGLPRRVAAPFAPHRSSGMRVYMLQPFLIGLSGAFGMSVGYALFDRVARAFSKKQPVA